MPSMEAFHNKVFKPTLWLLTCIPRWYAVYCIALLFPHQQTNKMTNPPKKNALYVVWVSELSFPEGFSQRRIPDVCCWVEKKIRQREAKNGQRGVCHLGQIILTCKESWNWSQANLSKFFKVNWGNCYAMRFLCTQMCVIVNRMVQ